MYEKTFPNKRFKYTLDFLKKHISTSETLLDLGVPNPFSKIMLDHGYKVVNTIGEDIDIDQTALKSEEYDVVTFNRMAEPSLFSPWPRPIIRAEHMFYYPNYKPSVENYFISDYPFEYMSLYANAHEIHTDLVHGTVMGLMYNRPVKYYHDSKRSYCFDAAGAEVSDDGFLRLSPEILQKKKNEMIRNVREILSGQIE